MSERGNPAFDPRSSVSTECDECGASIPDDVPHMVNPHHDESCSLHAPADCDHADGCAQQVRRIGKWPNGQIAARSCERHADMLSSDHPEILWENADSVAS